MNHEHQAGEVDGYRPVSGLAVAALLAGCGSALVLFTSLAAVLPLVAIAMAVAALADLRRSESRRAGRVAALAGLALAVGFTAQAVAAAVVEHWIASRRAAATARTWIDAVREQRYGAALGLCSPAALPRLDRGPLSAEPVDADRQAVLRAMPAVVAVAACGTVRPEVSLRRNPQVAEAWVASVDLAGCSQAGAVLRLDLEPRPTARGPTTIERWSVTGIRLDR